MNLRFVETLSGWPACKASRGRPKLFLTQSGFQPDRHPGGRTGRALDRTAATGSFRLTNAAIVSSTTLNAFLRCSSTSNASWAPRAAPASPHASAVSRRYCTPG